jgi:heme/copper-type cytochrome/quinol oxidase subunit 2
VTALEPGLANLASATSAWSSAFSSTLAAAPGDWKYWLPPNYSTHGDKIDLLFTWIFWITTVTFFLVEGTLLVFLVKYRQRPDRRKGTFTHGNTRLEMVWTLVPAVILLVIALATKRVWDSYRFSAIRDDPDRATILVVGEQFKWNFVYPGPDQKLGRYMSFPQPTDGKYKTMNREAALKEIGNYISGTNPLGQVINAKDPTDPGLDDDYAKNPGRPLILPAERSIDVNLSAKDVLHDFFLPEFRVKLDAVPGMRGHIYFKSKPEARCTQRMPLEKVPADKQVWLDPSTPKVEIGGNPKRYRLYDPTDTRRGPTRRYIMDSFDTLNQAAERRLRRANSSATPEQIAQALPAELDKLRADLKGMGISDLSVVQRHFEIVCEELCGMGHGTMRGEMYMVSNDEYVHYLNLSARPGAPTPPAKQPVADASGAR